MTIFLGFTSAYEFYHDERVRRRPPREAAGLRRVEDAEAGSLAVCTAVERAGLEWLTTPVHVLVGSADKRRRSDQVCAHVCAAELPRGSFMQVAPGIVVPSPALMFVQAAQFLSTAQLARFGVELVGTYRTDLRGGPTSYKLAPTVSCEALAAYLGRCPSINGVEQASRALRYVVDDSASPMETLLLLLLCLPSHMGGYGFELPVMNAPLTIRQESDVLSLRPDLYWPVHKVGLEYDSNQFHAGIGANNEDSSRRTKYALRGAGVRSVTREQLFNVEEFHTVALALARDMKRRLRFVEKPAFVQARARLRSELFAQR